MTVLRSIAMALACFSRIPMPNLDWSERNMRYMMAAFPLVGAIVGGLLILWAFVCDTLGFGAMLRGAGIALLPLAITGGIHMDGFADVVDALASHAPTERKREILEDPHVGSFAVMGIACYVVGSFALSCEVEACLVPVLACTFVVSRCMSGLASLTWTPAKSSGMLASMRSASSVAAVRALLALELAASAIAMLAINTAVGIAILVVGAVLFAWVARIARVQFGGTSGDLSGFLLQVEELAMLAALVVVGRLV